MVEKSVCKMEQLILSMFGERNSHKEQLFLFEIMKIQTNLNLPKF